MKHTALCYAMLAGLLALDGCARSPPDQFYTLGAGSAPAVAHVAAYSVVIGPVSVPAMVDRPQMVLRTAPGRVTLAEQSRWAEPLKDAIGRVLADDLAQQLQGAPVGVYAEGVAGHATYQVVVDVRQFESIPGDAAVIDAHWLIRDADNNPVQAGRSLVREPAGGAGYDALVAAHDRALAGIGRDIAAALRKVVPPR